MLRFSLIFCLSMLAVGSTLPAQKLKPFPFFNRSDPKIETRVFVHAPRLKLACKEVGVLPFPLSNQPESQRAFLRDLFAASTSSERQGRNDRYGTHVTLGQPA